MGLHLNVSDFLEGALYIKEYEGVRIGVTLSGRYNYSRCNFHGSVIDLKNNDALYLHDVLIPKERQDLGHLRIDFDVLETTRVRLQLPDRSSIVEDDQYKALCQEARIALYEFLAMQSQHQASYAKYKEAHKLGVELKESSPYLFPFFVAANDSGYDSQMFASSLDREGDAIVINPNGCALVNLPDSTEGRPCFYF